MDTPHLPQTLFCKDFENVYEPAEDTFLLLDALEKELSLFKNKAWVCLECGSGSGAIITALSKSFKDTKPTSRLMIATDINIDACKTTKKCATYHNQPNIQVIKTNIAESLVDRLENTVDLLIFNPPYVPTGNDVIEASSTNQLYLSWAGGNSGRELIDIFLKYYVPRLLSKPDGVAYLVALSRNNIDDLLNYLVVEHNIQGSVSMQRKAGIELLYVIKYEWMSTKT